MALFKKTVTPEPTAPEPKLADRLAVAGYGLRDTVEQQAYAEVTLLAQAADARAAAERAGKQADAVEQAVKLLDDAGVTL